MKILNFLKKNTMMTVVVISYLLLFIFKFDFGVTAVKNSTYYIIEMFQIMPVVFLLTALLDVWVPRETIIKYLGEDSKWKGILFAFILGSVSAGPIYAAFPICVLLLRKGATIKNIVIILSAWAVIKIPMLINEVAFLGVKFMAIRWTLTIIAIIIFSTITDIIVKEKDLPSQDRDEEVLLVVNQKACVGCGLCEKRYPSYFEIKDKKAYVINSDNGSSYEEELNNLARVCPMKAINCR